MSIRKVKKISLAGVLMADIAGEKPKFIWVNPEDLYIESAYQRDLSDASITLIRKIAGAWNWTHTKPPVCIKVKDHLYVVDGQHTAIAAASRSDIDKIPVVVLEEIGLSDRARAFVAHNTLRVQITPSQIFYSEVASGDEVAKAVIEACEKAGAKILRVPPSHGIFKRGETMAVGSMKRIAKDKGVPGLSRVLKILIKAGRAPLAAPEMNALYQLFWGKDFQGKVDDYDLVSIIASKSIPQWRFAAEKIRIQKGISGTMAVAHAWSNAL